MSFVAIEELHAQRVLELLDLHGQGGLADVEFFSGAGEVAAAGDFEKPFMCRSSVVIGTDAKSAVCDSQL